MEVVALIEGGTEILANTLEEEDESPSSSCDRVDECTSGDLVDEGDQLAEKMEAVISDTGNGRHVLELIDMAKEGKEQMVTMIHRAVLEQLKTLGVNIEPPAKRGRAKARKSKSVKPDIADYDYNKLVDVQIPSVSVTLKVPFLIQEVCQYLRKHIDAEHIFRRMGSVSKVKNIMERFASSDNNEPFPFTEFDTVYNVATVLSQYLEEMEPPLISYDLLGLLDICFELPSKESREEAVLLCTSLIPEFNMHIFVYLIEFLNEVAEHSLQNQMDLKNLAIVFSFYIMPLNISEIRNKDFEEKKQILEAHAKIMQILIGNGDKVGYLPRHVEQKIEEDFPHCGSEDKLENDAVARTKRGRFLGFLKNMSSSKSNDASVRQCPLKMDSKHTSYASKLKNLVTLGFLRRKEK